ncbi:MAG TPA: hypothetical protein VHS96_17125 [Bacteroidia bacterium]|nr:hypothetical protein [Bacteroidia bacterium]
MDRVKPLYFSLSPSEKKAIRYYLAAFHQKGENKAVEFLKLLDAQPEISHEASSQKLYNDPRSKAFIMMKSRLSERITEFLTLSVNPDANRRDRDAPYYQDLIEFRKCMLYASALQERQLSSHALEALEKARALAACCNAPELEVDALIRLRGLDRSGTDRFEELSIQIQKALKQQECDINATGLMRKFMTLSGGQSGGDEARIAFLEAHLPSLEDAIRQVYSVRADYFLQMLKVHLCYLTRKLEDGRTFSKRGLQILIDHEGIRSPLRMADSWFQLGRLELQGHAYDDALASFDKARSFQTEESRAHLSTSLLMLYCQIYRRDHAMANQLVEQIKHGPALRGSGKNPFNRGIFTYLSACVSFVQGALKDAWMLVQECQEFALDKETWLTGIRLFEIMVLVEKNEPDLASQKLESLRKHMSRYTPEPRSRAIFKMLMAQERLGFSFAPIQDEAQQIANLQQGLYWDPIGQEVIRFDEWYLERRARKAK